MLDQQDYTCIGIIAKHCDNSKLCVAERQAMDFDLKPLYCDFWIDILTIWDEIIAYRAEVAACDINPECTTPPVEPENYDYKVNLIFGGEFTVCNGKKSTHAGVARVLTYYSYARYVMLNGFNDTATGLVQKTNEFSIPIDQKSLKDLSDQYRNMGFATFNETINYLCTNKDVFSDFTPDDCGGFGCGSKSCGGTKAKGFGFRSGNITKTI